MAYLLDANIFIEAKNRYYGFDLCPGFWDWIERSSASGSLFSISQVEGELSAGSDQLAEWAGARGATFFLEPDASTVASLALVARWVTSQQFEPAAINNFLQAADYYLVARAHAASHSWSPQRSPPNRSVASRFPMSASVWVCATWMFSRCCVENMRGSCLVDRYQ
ncbi:MAG: DUF4411 family protein [Burkholderiaceae bacterium]